MSYFFKGFSRYAVGDTIEVCFFFFREKDIVKNQKKKNTRMIQKIVPVRIICVIYEVTLDSHIKCVQTVFVFGPVVNSSGYGL